MLYSSIAVTSLAFFAKNGAQAQVEEPTELFSGRGVGKENVQENSWNNANVQTADVLAREPLKRKTYAAVVRRNTHCVIINNRSERMRV
jgi:hypothetical protein